MPCGEGCSDFLDCLPKPLGEKKKTPPSTEASLLGDLFVEAASVNYYQLQK